MKPTVPADSLVALDATGTPGLVSRAAELWLEAPGSKATTGRSDAADVAVDDDRMSRLHCSVTHRPDGGLEIADLGSRNGTFVDGAQVQRAPLSIGSVVRTGDTCWVVVGHRTEGGRSAASVRLTEELEAAGRTDAPVLLVGPTGAGKDHAAKALHALRGRGAFVAISAAAMPPSLAAASLFGQEGADGLIVQADGGTLLIDDLESLSLDVQRSLVRTIKDGQIVAVGSSERRQVDVSIVACSRAAVGAEVLAGRLLPELLARFSGWHLRVTPLVERREDVLPLLSALGGDPSILHPDAVEALLLHDWPFSVRELQGMVERWAAEGLERVGLRELPESIARRLHARREGAPSPEAPPADGLLIASDCSWFEPASGARVNLKRRHVTRRVLARLLATVEGPPASLDDLLSAGWPGQSVGWEAGCNRVYVAVATLRKLGLGDRLATSEDGYILRPPIDVHDA